MSASKALRHTRINWQLLPSKLGATDLTLLEPISTNSSDYVPEYQPYEVAPPKILEISNPYVKTQAEADRTQMWADFDALFGAWADREDVGDDWLENLRAGWNTRLADIYEADGE